MASSGIALAPEAEVSWSDFVAPLTEHSACLGVCVVGGGEKVFFQSGQLDGVSEADGLKPLWYAAW